MSLAILQKWLKFNYMKFIKIIDQKKYALISIFLFLYVIINLFEGERGLISFYKKQQIKEQLFQEKDSLTVQLNLIKKKNNLLTENIDLDYLETLLRQKFMVGKTNEIVYINK